MNNKVFRFGPVALTNAAANVFNVPTATGGVNAGSSANYAILRQVDFVNKTAGAVTISMYVGATGGSAAGTEVMGTGLSVAANSTYSWRGYLRLDSGDFLTGLASANTSITVTGMGEIGVAG